MTWQSGPSTWNNRPSTKYPRPSTEDPRHLDQKLDSVFTEIPEMETSSLWWISQSYESRHAVTKQCNIYFPCSGTSQHIQTTQRNGSNRFTAFYWTSFASSGIFQMYLKREIRVTGLVTFKQIWLDISNVYLRTSWFSMCLFGRLT